MTSRNTDKTRDSKGSDGNKAEHKNALPAKKSAQKAHSKAGKGDVRYWQAAVKRLDSPHYSVQIQYQGKRHRFPLSTTERQAAGKKAQAIYVYLLANGWEATFNKFKPKSIKAAKVGTVGALIAAAESLADVRPPTFRGYTAALRKIASEIQGIDAVKGRYARCGEEREAWLAAVDSVPLSALTKEAVEAWKMRYVKTRSADVSKERSARTSANAYLRMAKGLFSKELLPSLAQMVVLPKPAPFDGVKLFSRLSMRYVSTFNMKAVEVAAWDELQQSDPEAFKAFLLSYYSGMRRNEVDKLRWRSLETAEVVKIEVHAHFNPKAETSIGEIPLPVRVSAALKDLRGCSFRDEYVLMADIPKRRGNAALNRHEATPRSAKFLHYRANSTFKRLSLWLRTHGVNTRTPIHTMRKEAGSAITEKYGLFLASRFLRHADVGITAQHYAAPQQRAVMD